MKYYAGIDIGGTRIKMGIIDETGHVCVQENEATQSTRSDLMKQIGDFIKQHQEYTMEGVGISMPGIAKDDGFMQTSGAIKCFLKHNMKQEMEAYLKLPVVIENDSKSASIAEKSIGEAKDLDNFVCLTLGTAVGGAIYMDGKLVRGLGGMAGEFGIALCGKEKGNYNEQSFSYSAAVVAGLCRNYSYRVKERVLDAKEIYRRAHENDQDAIACIEQFYHDVALLLINTAVIIAPDAILIGGGISANEEAMHGIISAYEEIIQDYHVLSLVEMPKILACKLKNEAGMIGAARKLMLMKEKI